MQRLWGTNELDKVNGDWCCQNGQNVQQVMLEKETEPLDFNLSTTGSPWRVLSRVIS